MTRASTVNPHFPLARGAVQDLRASRIREVANAAMGAKDVLAFWFGEPDEVTPAFVRDAAKASLDAGETFYSQNLGIPELRAAIAAYVSSLHAGTFPAGRIAATGSGVSALMLVSQALVGPGDRVVAVTPLWPNLVEIPKILGASVHCVPLAFGPNGWQLDLDLLLAALTPETRAVYINSPNNPTGWTIDREAQRTVLAHCRRHGIWIVADDAYERLYYPDFAAATAPSFLSLADPGDRLVSANTFSKPWLMTGWRLGWLVVPEPLVPAIEKLVEYNTSCVPVFVQRAGIAALSEGERVVGHFVERLRRGRDLLVAGLLQIPGIEVATPPGAMYVFFRVDGVRDSLELAKQLVAGARLGLAPGIAFGPEGEGFLRWCYASSEARLAEGVARLARFLGAAVDRTGRARVSVTS